MATAAAAAAKCLSICRLRSSLRALSRQHSCQLRQAYSQALSQDFEVSPGHDFAVCEQWRARTGGKLRSHHRRRFKREQVLEREAGHADFHAEIARQFLDSFPARFVVGEGLRQWNRLRSCGLCGGCWHVRAPGKIAGAMAVPSDGGNWNEGMRGRSSRESGRWE